MKSIKMLIRKCIPGLNLVTCCMLLSLLHLVRSQMSELEYSATPHARPPTSPCPGVFTYDPREPGSGKWYGVVFITTNVKLVGFTLDIKLDRPADLLGNWQGEVETEDNTRFSITSTSKKINPGPPVALRIFVKHGTRPAPHIVTIKLNGRKICPGAATTTRRPTVSHTVATSRPVAATSRPGTVTTRPGAVTSRPGVVTPRPATSSVTRPVVAPPVALGLNECGRVHVQPQALITHGQGTERGQWPWHVAMYQNKGKDLTYICGGSLIGRKAVVTAAHCVTRRPSDRAVDPDTLVLYFGKYHLLLWSDGGVQNKQVQQVIVHPNYNSSNFRGDLAILTLKSVVDYTEFVKPVCLWNTAKTDLTHVQGKEGTVVGWGFDETGTVSSELMLARMPVVSQETCLRSYPDFFTHFTSDQTYCAGFRNGTSVCNGDSGGGMYFPEKKSTEKANTWYLRGLVSLSPSKADERICDTSHYVVFTDLAKYLPWITQYINLK